MKLNYNKSMTFIDELRKTIPMDIRSLLQKDNYLEAVVSLKDIGALEKELVKHIGPPSKLSGAILRTNSELKKIINEIGGIMIEQTLFYRREKDAVLYAMLWPWESDQSRITLKAGIIKTK